ncbi:MAG: cytochrome c [Hyphomicrobiales bacterium]|nr:cytochrome c [Hyphomicrobiales bacterium]
MSRSVALAVVLITLGLAADMTAAAAERVGIGHAISPQDFAAWDIDVRGDGAGLPPGQGSVTQGREIFSQTCAACHGDKGEGRAVPGAVGGFDRLVGGFGTLDTASPTLTVGSYWPYATTLFDYVRRAMPFNAPQSLTNDQLYAVSAYVLYMNNIVPEDAVLDALTLPRVKMPNQEGFITQDPRPDVRSKP